MNFGIYLNYQQRNPLIFLLSIHDLDLFSLNSHTNINLDYNLSLRPIRSNYYSPYSFSQLPKSIINESSFSLIHNNIRSLKRNGENLQSHLLNELNCHFSVIGITETRIKKSDIPLDFNMDIPNYNFEFVPTPLNAGCVSMYIDNCLKYTVVENISNEAFQALWIEISLAKRSNIICGVIYIYRQHNSPDSFLKYILKKPLKNLVIQARQFT